jgi:hypothetical protein
MRLTNTPARWILCFLVLPVLWVVLGAGTGLYAVLMIPAAALAASLSALTAYRSGKGTPAAVGYFVGTGVMMGAVFMMFVATVFTIYCGDGDTSGGC